MRPAAAVAEELAAPELVSRILEAAAKNSSWGNAGELYATATPGQAVMCAFEELAGELATVLLGRGFGTGEYELYGAFTADLATGDLVDDPDAAKPDPEA